MGIRRWAAAALTAFAVTCAGQAQAAVLFSSIPDLTVAPEADWNATSPTDDAGLFSLSGTSKVTAVEFVADLSTDLTDATVRILTDDDGALGSVLYSQGTAADDISSSETANGTRLMTVQLNEDGSYAPGTYWLQISGDNTRVEGFSGSDSMIQCDLLSDCTQTNQTLGFEILGGDPGGEAFPEPTTWTLMIAGLGLLGLALRRQRALTA
jgi:PEP-CTERM motif